MPKKTPKGPKMTPKRDPRSTPKRPKFDMKIVSDFDAKTKKARHGLSFRLWAETPQREAPWELLGGAPGAQVRRPRHHGTALPGTQAPMCPFET